ncbi:hypothetical protein CVT24_008237 [Panaeolus cyanescens]|uniref:WSC domain-containing protein n=1 Tax=Panaeolus cyanescens TaxID=181874 RepID=A0A409YR28_9AGAR|nr:hypothetical protein CVT24_008237 [Panaeolus cyanescens]
MTSNAPSQPSQIPSLVPAPQGWIYVGCYEDSQLRTLDGGFRGSSSTTVISCISTCQGNGFSFAGVEAGSQCYCGNSIRAGATKKTETECGMACTGDASQRCGDIWRLNIYQAQSRPAAPSSPTTTFPKTTSPAPPPAPSPSTSEPSSTTVTSISLSTSTRPSNSLIRTGSETTSSTVTSDTTSTASTSSAISSTTLPPPIDQIFTPDDTHSKTSLSSAAVAGIAVATTAIAAILIVFLILLVRKRRKKMKQIAMTQHATMPAPYTNTRTYRDTHPEGLPSYDDLETNVGRTSIPISPVTGPVGETKARLQPCRPPVPIEAPTDDSLSYLSAGSGDTNRVNQLS